MEWEVKLVNSRGFSWISDCHSLTPVSSIKLMKNYKPLITSNNKASTIYVCSSALRDFVNSILHRINTPFILICGDCDENFPQQCLSPIAFQELISNTYLVHIFAQNCFLNHSKITRIPIGLDFHTIRHIDKPIHQETTLFNIVSNSQPFTQRIPLIYSNFHFALQYASRKEAYTGLDNSLVYYEPSRADRTDSWRKQAQYAFVASPRGNGEDCHRTWEALVLGCIPIVKSSPLDPLYEDLPVLIINNWSDVNSKLLENTIHEFSNKTFNPNKLNLSYWKNLIDSYR